MKRPTTSCLVIAFAVLSGFPMGACTTAVISGAATADGRPLLWKNRDSDSRLNQVVYGADGRYAYLGLANADDPAGFQVWAGVNSAGFAIMNSASYNIETADTQDEGRFMKLALQSCADIEEFQSLVARTDGKSRDTSANFGVIDARGGAAYFEVGKKGFKRYDASDPKEAPGGILVRTNYSASGDAKLGTGFWRMRRARHLAEDPQKGGHLELSDLLKGMARDFGNEALDSSAPVPPSGTMPRWAYTGDSICRRDTVSCVAVSGVKRGEDPLLTTFWVIPGQPLTGVAVPLWVGAGSVPDCLMATRGAAPMARACEDLCALVYPDTRGDLARYLDAQAYRGPLQPLWEALLGREAENLERSALALEAWRKSPPKPGDISALQEELAKKTLALEENLVEKFSRTLPAQNPRKGGKPGAAPRPPEARQTPKSGCGT